MPRKTVARNSKSSSKRPCRCSNGWTRPTASLLIPALADGQLALVIDDKLTSKHFAAPPPATEKPMPMIEARHGPRHQRRQTVQEGAGEYRAVINGLIDAVRQIEGSNVPETFEIPEPEIIEDASGTIYSFTPPAEAGFDEQIKPNVGVSETVAVFSISPAPHRAPVEGHATRRRRLAGARASVRLAVAAWLHWADLVKAAAPWADFAAQRIMADKNVDDASESPSLDQVHTVARRAPGACAPSPSKATSKMGCW